MTNAHRTKRIYEEVTTELQMLVQSGKFKPGDRLPPERQLAIMFAVSRNSVREAIKSLEQQGMLISRPGAGTFIVASSQTDLHGALGQILSLARNRLADIFELRLLLEPQIAHLAAQRVTEEGLCRLQSLLSEYESALIAEKPVHDLDQAFHDALAAATGNPCVMGLMEKIQELLCESRDEPLQSALRNWESLEGHRLILDALQRHDCEAARTAMIQHITLTQKIVFTHHQGAR